MVILFFIVMSVVLSCMMALITKSYDNGTSHWLDDCDVMFDPRAIQKKMGFPMNSSIVTAAIYNVVFIWLAFIYWMYRFLDEEDFEL